MSREHWFQGEGRWASASFLVFIVLLLALAGPASADAPKLLLRIPRDSVVPGSGANQLNNPRDIAADPDTGRLFISQFNQHRIGEFTAWGEFVKAWGWDVSPEGAPGDTAGDGLEVCTTICQAGVPGSEPGQLRNPTGLTVDGVGDVYVYDGITGNHRVQKFSPAGEFLLMFGDGVNQGPTNPGDVCTAADVVAGDTCGPGTEGSGPAQFENTLGNFIAYGAATNSIFVGDTDMIQEFNLDGTFKKPIPFEGELEAFDGRAVTSLDTDLASNLYIALEGLDDVHKLSPAGAPLLTFAVKSPFAVAVDRKGVDSGGEPDDEPNVYAIESQARVLGFEASGAPIEGMEPGDGFASEGVNLIGLGTNLCPGSELPGNLYVSYFSFGSAAFVNAYGTPPFGCEAPPIDAPAIVEEYAISVDTEGAVVKAEIDPNLRNDTTFFVQYGTAACRDSGWTSGCATTEVAKLSESATDFPLTTEGVFLGGLLPATTYFYRFVAQSAGGTALGAGNSFRTFSRQTTPDCPANAHLRTDSAALLPDCRAYEMVSPLDKNNGDIRFPLSRSSAAFPLSLFQAAAAGGAFTYSSSSAFGEVESAPLVSQYLARRDSAQGWTSEALSPHRTRQVGDVLDTEFKQFSADLCQAWLRHDSDPPLTADAVPGYFNLYRIDYCGGGGYEALTTEKPPSVPCEFPNPGVCPAQYFPLELQGTSADGAKAIYVAPDNLAGAPANGDTRIQLYFFAGGKLSFACILPDGSASTKGCSAGTYGNDFGNGRLSALHNALSADGSVLYWSEGPKSGFQPGVIESRRLFVRVHPEQGAIGAEECTDPQKACTYPVSDAVSPAARAQFWAAADDGSKAIFTIEDGALAGNLYQFDLARAKAGEAPNTLIAEEVKGVMGVSEDANRIYFVSTKDLDGGGEAEAEELNLYFHDSGTGTYTLIAALAQNDLPNGTAISPVEKAPFLRSSRVTSDGRHAAFTSTAPLTGYDNRDAVSSEADTEVFLYDADSDKLVCASCNPSGARPAGRQPRVGDHWIASQIPGSERALYASRLLSEDGRRLFFESFDALVPRDTNGEQDVYQWEALGKGDCDEADSGFAPASGGCVELISSGESTRESTFFDASLSGDDVFFTTLSPLLSQDYGLVDVYDARVGGGFPPPPAAKEPCEGEACQSPPAPPEWPTPASMAYEGPGDVKPARKRRCAKGKRRVVRKGKVRCIRKKGRRANDNRGAGR